jgi:hypothetical protein|tara:strand:+ start:105 stop:308 length:204 start_codon:yes stop_codon:yes gene_type:complete
MTSAVAKVVMSAMKKNNLAIIKAMAQRANMSRGRLVSTAKAVSRKTPKTKKMTNREKMLRSRKGQDA